MKRWRCAWCSGYAHRPEGVYLRLLAFLICDGCGRPTLRCECEP